MKRFLASRSMFITTTPKPSTTMLARAELVAERCCVSFVRRGGSLPALMEEQQSRLVYVVRRDHDELRLGDTTLFVHPGMVVLKRATGRRHPFLRALLLHGPCSEIVDATIGLGADALHAATELGVDVRGIEGSPVVFSLLEEGLGRLSAEASDFGRGAAKIRAELGGATEALRRMKSASADVVTIDPMFDTPRPAAHGFELLRKVAHTAEPPAPLLAEARRVARTHVVLKYPKRSTYPECDACVDGKAVRYLIYDATPR
ncbi:MAG: class I SAM-dependent methyltransferase [Myxococcota bacterium]